MAYLIIGLHTWATWGYTGPFWGDFGVTLNHAELMRHERVPYRDFFAPYPPLWYWSIAGWSRLFGASMDAVAAFSALLIAGILPAQVRYVARLVPHETIVPTTIASIVLAIVAGQIESAPLPLGSYAPHAVIGGMSLLGAVVVALRTEREPSAALAALVGVLAALAFLSKHDFWVPSLYLVGVSVVMFYSLGHRRYAAITTSGFLGVMLLGILAVVRSTTWSTLRQVVTGFGFATEYGLSRALPSWELLTVEGLCLSLTVAAGAIAALVVREFRRRALGVLGVALAAAVGLGGLHVYASITIGRGMVHSGLPEWPTPTQLALAGAGGDSARVPRAAVLFLKERVQGHILPLLLLLLLGVAVIARWRRLAPGRDRLRLLALLGLCVAARARRGFEHMDWLHVMLELPVYALALHLFMGHRIRQPTKLIMAGYAVVGVLLYWATGVGPLTRRGTYEPVATERGTARWHPSLAADFRAIEQALLDADPSKERPVFSLGHNGGFSYWLRRPSVTPVAFGFTPGVPAPDSILGAMLESRPPPFVILHDGYMQLSTPMLRPDLARWEQPVWPNRYMRHDRSYVADAVSTCRMLARVPSHWVAEYRIFDCGRPVGMGSHQSGLP
ncbi:MAG TPA: hypothetical protein VJ812_05670 [Gemmatimonadaceae bacterium]|nr:hypothetical protein [Gemmatimonadaceae bacterium]